MKGTIETTELEDREGIFAQIDKLEKEVLEKYEKALDDAAHGFIFSPHGSAHTYRTS